jgi:hypothetical protein
LLLRSLFRSECNQDPGSEEEDELVRDPRHAEGADSGDSTESEEEARLKRGATSRKRQRSEEREDKHAGGTAAEDDTEPDTDSEKDNEHSDPSYKPEEGAAAAEGAEEEDASMGEQPLSGGGNSKRGRPRAKPTTIKWRIVSKANSSCVCVWCGTCYCSD